MILSIDIFYFKTVIIGGPIETIVLGIFANKTVTTNLGHPVQCKIRKAISMLHGKSLPMKKFTP